MLFLWLQVVLFLVVVMPKWTCHSLQPKRVATWPLVRQYFRSILTRLTRFVTALGDPLIKGLTEVANKRPEDPIAYLATYLYNFANNRQNLHSRGKTQVNFNDFLIYIFSTVSFKQENQQTITGPPQDADNNKAVPATIEVVTVDPEDSGTEEDSAFNSTSRVRKLSALTNSFYPKLS
jgi:hypothetical protein